MDLINQIIKAVAHPVAVLDRNNMIVAINPPGFCFIGLTDEQVLPISFGLAVSCVNANNYGKCGTTVFCELCKLNSSLEYLFDNPHETLSRDCVFCSVIDGLSYVRKIQFSATYLDVDEGFVIVSFLEDGKLSQAESNEVAQPESIDSEVSMAQAINESLIPDDALSTKHHTLPFQVILEMERTIVNTLFEHYANGILLFDALGNLIKVNKRFVDLFGLTFDEIHKLVVNGMLFTTDDLIETFENDKWSLLQSVKAGVFRFSGKHLNPKINLEVFIDVDIIPLVGSRNSASGFLVMVTDKSSEKSLIQQVKYSFQALEFSPYECYYLRPHGDVVYANLIARRNFEWSEADTLKYKIFNIVNDGDSQWWHNTFNELKRKRILQYESSHIKPDGTSYYVSVLLYFLDVENNDLVCYFATDISDKKSSEAEMNKKMRINSSFSEISHELTFSDKFESVVLQIRQYALEITKSDFCFLNYYSPEHNELVSSVYSDSDYSFKEEVNHIGKYLADFYNNVFWDSSMKRQASRKMLNDSIVFLVDNKPIRSILPFEKMAWVGVFFHDEYKGLLLVARSSGDYEEEDLANLENLTNLFSLAVNRIHEKAKLIKTNSRLTLALEVANIGMFEHFPVENITIVSPQLNQMLGGSYNELELSIDEFNKLIHPDDQVKSQKAFIDLIQKGTEFFNFTIRAALPGCPYRWYHTSGRIVRYANDGTPLQITGVQFDITDQIELTEQLSNSREEAIAANKAKSTFLARVTHELRTPLNAIIGLTELLSANLTTPIQVEYLANIKNNSQTLMKLISDVLDYSKIEAGLLNLSVSSVNLHSMLRDIRQMFAGISAEKQLEFIYSIQERLPRNVFIDELRVKQILINLIGNAVKFTESGFVKLSVAYQQEGDESVELFFSVEDSGIGIKESAHKTIFNDFTQQEDQDNRRFGGTGLGLGIVRQLVSLMGGEIKLESEPDKGSCFSFSIPKCQIGYSDGDILADVKAMIMSDIANEEELNLPVVDRDDLNLFNQLIGDEWRNFVMMPSFKTIDTITQAFDLMAQKSNSDFFSYYAQQLDFCKKTFSVGELNKIIKEIERTLNAANK